MGIVGSPTSVGDICLVIVSVGTDHNIRSGSVAEGGGIDPGSTHVGDIWSKADICWGSLVKPVLVQGIWLGSMSVEDVGAPTKVPGGL